MYMPNTTKNLYWDAHNKLLIVRPFNLALPPLQSPYPKHHKVQRLLHRWIFPVCHPSDHNISCIWCNKHSPRQLRYWKIPSYIPIFTSKNNNSSLLPSNRLQTSSSANNFGYYTASFWAAKRDWYLSNISNFPLNFKTLIYCWITKVEWIDWKLITSLVEGGKLSK